MRCILHSVRKIFNEHSVRTYLVVNLCAGPSERVGAEDTSGDAGNRVWLRKSSANQNFGRSFTASSARNLREVRPLSSKRPAIHHSLCCNASRAQPSHNTLYPPPRCNFHSFLCSSASFSPGASRRNSSSLNRCSAASSSTTNNSNKTSEVIRYGTRNNIHAVSLALQMHTSWEYETAWEVAPKFERVYVGVGCSEMQVWYSTFAFNCVPPRSLQARIHLQMLTWIIAPCSNYLCPGTLSCVSVPHHCPCAFPNVEDKVELGEGSAICGSKGGWADGEFQRKVELARKGLL